MIVQSTAWDQHKEVATTLDDSMGEAFDKVAKMLDLGYPGGPAIEQLAKKGDAMRFDLPLPLRQKSRLAFSYSGLKNSMRLLIEKQGDIDAQTRADLAAAFQRRAIDHLLQKSETYLRRVRPRRLGVVGGVSANATLRSALEQLCGRYDCELLLAPLAFCSDNAAMIARAAREDLTHGRFIQPAEITIRSRCSIA
jgi:N6-L-threonylcarbamoyladenine synthase